MAVISTGNVPKAIGGVSAAPPVTRSQGPQAPAVLSMAPNLQVAALRRLRGQIGGAGAQAMHNEGGCAYHNDGGCAYR